VTMSLFDLSKMQPLNDAIAGLQQGLAADPSAAVEFFRAVDGSSAFAYSPDPAQNYDMRDLGQIAAQLAAGGSSLATAAAAVSTALDGVVLHHIEGSGHTGASGCRSTRRSASSSSGPPSTRSPPRRCGRVCSTPRMAAAPTR
jgi:hypothetical protein